MSKSKSKQFKVMAAQGDVMLVKINELPSKTFNEAKRENGKLIITHSETGHHHVIENPTAKLWEDPSNKLLSYLELPQISDLVHKRPFDKHDTITISPGIYEVRRQREHTPEGWKKVQD